MIGGITPLAKKTGIEFGFSLNPVPVLLYHEMLAALPLATREEQGERSRKLQEDDRVMEKEPESRGGKVCKADDAITPSSQNVAQEGEQEAEKLLQSRLTGRILISHRFWSIWIT